MKKYIRVVSISAAVMLMAAGCGENAGKKEEETEPAVEEFNLILDDQRTQVIVRDEADAVKTEPAAEQETETAADDVTTVTAYADHIAGDDSISYDIETAVYENGVVRVEYPQLTHMTDEEKQQEINENIRRTAADSISVDSLNSYELHYETAAKGAGIVSFIFRGTEYYENSAHPDNIVKTLNINLNTGKNVRLKDFADISLVVSYLELGDGYTILNEGVDPADFSAYLNYGAVTDYAITLLDYDIDFGSPEMVPAGFSAIRDNHLILFIKAEHAMGDYVELEFDWEL